MPDQNSTDAVRQGLVSYMVELAANRGEDGQVLPEARQLMERTAAVLGDEAKTGRLADELSAEPK